MNAIGATQKQIQTLFILESGIIGLIGGIIGVKTGITLSTIAAYGATQTTNIQINAYLAPQLIIGATIFSFLIGALLGVLPARRAAKLPPATALRHE